MTTAAVEPKRSYTYDDLAALPDDQRYEIIDGELWVNPSPITRHQKLAHRLAVALDQLERSGAGNVFSAPLDVVFSKRDVVQPDLMFIAAARASVIGEKNITGAPDLVVEI